ncbi:conserved hypothetical protein [Thermotomaculum hydrothermale]|uniref:Polymerase/histidinol phosphatase N-terminal domain-containing protein n=1 Tax=Thermotomaculum hydrothermale TaxID=981385 RepID=A0A7R6PYT1_9BACT|nr:PHP domain-containing protein [Thermotomaculum hydrothermale]BBB32128.1 conserved hypothetical protein [Thermotomaculum hydrothermale]
MRKLIDLHMHSTASDGTFKPDELVKLAKEKGLSAIALTDHDTAEGIEEFLKEGEKQGIETIAGIEISSLFEGYPEIHVLGYFIDPENREVMDKLAYLQDARKVRNIKLIAKLKELGIELSLEELEKEANGQLIGRPHFAALMVKKGFVKDTNEAFSKYIGNDGLAFVPKEKLTTPEAVQFLFENGIVPVLAHPTKIGMNTNDLIDFIILLKKHGLQGIEVIHSEISEKESKKLLELAYRFNLVPTGGSDFHGENKPFVKMGVPEVPYEFFIKLKERKNDMFSIMETRKL